MVVEETVKSAAEAAAATADNQKNPVAANPNPNSKGVAGSGDPELEEGEIAGEEDLAEQSAKEEPKADQAHPLEHSWTFWFDNLAAKWKQMAWGASMRPIYTFTTVEEIWRTGKMKKSRKSLQRWAWTKLKQVEFSVLNF